MTTVTTESVFPESTLLLGPTGSGKTPLAEYLSGAGLFGPRLHHFDFGEQLRRIGSERPGSWGEQDIAFVQRVVHEGVLLEDEHFALAVRIFHDFLEGSGYRYPEHVVLNGLPRHIGQARGMESITRIVRVVVLECEACEVHERIRMNTGGDREGRLDDSIDLIRRKLDTYRERTEPLVEHYRKLGIPVIRLSVDRTSRPDRVGEQLADFVAHDSMASLKG